MHFLLSNLDNIFSIRLKLHFLKWSNCTQQKVIGILNNKLSNSLTLVSLNKGFTNCCSFYHMFTVTVTPGNKGMHILIYFFSPSLSRPIRQMFLCLQ